MGPCTSLLSVGRTWRTVCFQWERAASCNLTNVQLSTPPPPTFTLLQPTNCFAPAYSHTSGHIAIPSYIWRLYSCSITELNCPLEKHFYFQACSTFVIHIPFLIYRIALKMRISTILLMTIKEHNGCWKIYSAFASKFGSEPVFYSREKNGVTKVPSTQRPPKIANASG